MPRIAKASAYFAPTAEVNRWWNATDCDALAALHGGDAVTPFRSFALERRAAHAAVLAAGANGSKRGGKWSRNHSLQLLDFRDWA